METKDFGKKLIAVRKAKGLTQEDVADQCNVTTRTIQRIENGTVTPRASTVKLISEALGFDFFEALNTSQDALKISSAKPLNKRTLMWYVKDLFNLKTNAMKKISILSSSLVLLLLLAFNIMDVSAQTKGTTFDQGLTIKRNQDQSVQKVSAVFTNDLTLDSLVQMQKDLNAIGITLNYKKMEFDSNNKLLSIECKVHCDDGYSGGFSTGKLTDKNRGAKMGFYRDYAPNSKTPFGTGSLANN